MRYIQYEIHNLSSTVVVERTYRCPEGTENLKGYAYIPSIRLSISSLGYGWKIINLFPLCVTCSCDGWLGTGLLLCHWGSTCGSGVYWDQWIHTACSCSHLQNCGRSSSMWDGPVFNSLIWPSILLAVCEFFCDGRRRLAVYISPCDMLPSYSTTGGYNGL